MAGIEVLDDDDARVVADLPVELPVTDVQRDDARGAALEQDVGEAASRRADVERLASGDVDAEGVERVRQLEPAAADIGMVGRDERDVGVGVDRRARPSRPAAPSTQTWPARISARARSRDGARPRSTSTIEPIRARSQP